MLMIERPTSNVTHVSSYLKRKSHQPRKKKVAQVIQNVMVQTKKHLHNLIVNNEIPDRHSMRPKL